MGSFVSERWANAEQEGIGTPRRQRQGDVFRAYLPDRLVARPVRLSAGTAADVSDAELALARFDTRVTTLHKTEALARLMLRAEAVASSYIEGLYISPGRVLRADAARTDGRKVADYDALGVLANVDAMTAALRNPGLPISLGRLNEVHRPLLAATRLADHGGRVRTQQNWIGGGAFSPIGARYIPPPARFVPDLLDDLCTFASGDDVSPVVQAALAHVQFESIHPYVDGNGRSGRALIYMVLRRRGLALRSIPPISRTLATLADKYFEALQATREEDSTSYAASDAIERWISLFAAACQRAVHDAARFEDRVEQIVQSWRGRLAALRSDSGALALIMKLPAEPIVTVRSVQRLINRPYVSANSAVSALISAQILRSCGGRRNRVFEAVELTDAFIDFERDACDP